MKIKKAVMMILLFAGLAGLLGAVGCSNKSMVAEKSGAQIWGENCIRCHNAPSPAAFSDDQWESITMHMRVGANLTAEETRKVVEFLKMAN